MHLLSQENFALITPKYANERYGHYKTLWTLQKVMDITYTAMYKKNLIIGFNNIQISIKNVSFYIKFYSFFSQ